MISANTCLLYTSGIAFDEAALEAFMKIKYEDSGYKADGKSYDQMLTALRGYADAGEYGCYITTLDNDEVLEEYNACLLYTSLHF